MSDNKKTVVVYFIGTQYKPEALLSYNVKNTVYNAPRTDKGKLDYGGAIRVLPHHVKELLDKSRHYTRGRGFSDVFTTDPNIAASVVKALENGGRPVISGSMTPDQYVALASDDVVLSRAAEMLGTTVDGLAEFLKRNASPSKESMEVPDEPETTLLDLINGEASEEGGDVLVPSKPKRGRPSKSE